MFALIIFYMLLLFYTQAPNCPVGYVGPGGLGDFGKHFNCTGGYSVYFDRKILGERHMNGYSQLQYISTKINLFFILNFFFYLQIKQ